MAEIVYPSEEKIEELNVFALAVVKVKKADRHKVLSRLKIMHALDECREFPGDAYGKAAVLLRALVKAHAFASGNRRTAFLACKHFLRLNKHDMRPANKPENARIMTGIREGYYSDDEIKEWIQHGKIRKFERG